MIQIIYIIPSILSITSFLGWILVSFDHWHLWAWQVELDKLTLKPQKESCQYFLLETLQVFKFVCTTSNSGAYIDPQKGPADGCQMWYVN